MSKDLPMKYGEAKPGVDLREDVAVEKPEALLPCEPGKSHLFADVEGDHHWRCPLASTSNPL